MNNLKSYTEYAVSTPTTDFVIGFDFNYGTDAVNVTVDGVPATEAGYSVIYLNSTTIRLNPAVSSGVVRLQRETDIDVPDNQFTAGAKFIASNMDENFTQLRHSQQEVRDGFGKLSEDTYEIIDTLQVVGEAAQDAADAAEQAAELANDAAAQVSDKVPKSTTLPTYLTVAAGVDPVTGVADGAYFNVRSSNDESYVDEYQNVSGSAVVTGKRYLSSLGVQIQEKPASTIKDESGKDQQEINDDLAKKVKIVTPYVFGAKGDRVTDDTVAIQAFWNYIATNLVETADITGDFVISADISANTGTGGATSWKDKPKYVQNIVGHMTLRPNGYSSPNAVLQFDGFRDTDFNGKFSIICPGSSNYSTRKNDVGVVFNNCTRLKSCHIEVWYAAGRAVVVSGNTSVTDIGSIDAWYCGATAAATGANNIALQTPTYVHTGTSGNTLQRTEITVAAGSIPRALQEDDFVLFFNSSTKYSEAKIIRGIDRVNNKITVFPWVYTSEESMTPYYVIGGGFYSVGGDTSAMKIGRLSSVACGVSCNAQSLYPVSIFNHVTQYCGIGFASGKSASEGGVTANMYCEANGMNDLACSGNAKYTYVSIGPLAEEWKLSHLQASATSGSNRVRGSAASPRSIAKTGFLPLAANGQLSNGDTQSFPRINTGKATPISLFVNMSEGGGARGTTVYLNYDEVANREFGLDTVWVMLHSSQHSGGMSGNAIFAPESGQSYTVNGQATWSTPISGPTLFCCRLLAGDWRVFRFDGIVDGQQTSRTASATYDPPSLAAAGTAGDSTTTTVTLNGAVVGDNVSAAFSLYNAGIRIYPVVSAANTVTVEFRNISATPIDLGSGTLAVKLI